MDKSLEAQRLDTALQRVFLDPKRTIGRVVFLVTVDDQNLKVTASLFELDPPDSKRLALCKLIEDTADELGYEVVHCDAGPPGVEVVVRNRNP